MSGSFPFSMPDDFPKEGVEALHLAVHAMASGTNLRQQLRIQRLRLEWGGAVNGVYYRFKACAEYDDLWRSSLGEHGPSPEFPARYKQERALYGFFTNALSAFECTYCAVAFMGALVKPSALQITSHPRKITTRKVAAQYRRAWQGHPLAQALTDLDKELELADLRNARNVLSHSAAPGRKHYAGGPLDGLTEWQREFLGPETTASKRRFVADAIRTISDRAQMLIAGQAPSSA